MPTVQELRERAKREQEKRRNQSSNQATPFATDGFFESTQYYNTPDTGRGCDTGSTVSDSSSSSCDSSSF